MKKWICVLLSLLLLVGSAMTVSAVPEGETEDRDIIMEPEKRADGSVVVWLNDETGSSVPSWIVYLEVDGVTVKTIDVDFEGAALIDYEFPEERVAVTCLSYTGPYDTVNYIGSRIDITDLIYDGSAAVTTTMPSETQPTESTTSTEGAVTTTEPSTTESTEASTTPEQSSLSFAPLTTTVREDGRVAIGVDVDNGVIKASQLTAEDFVINSRMWMDPSQYAQLVSTTDASLHLELTLNADAGSKSNLIAAKNKEATYSAYADSEVTGFAVNTALVYVDGDLRAPLDVADGRYLIEMPLPKCFEQCEKLAVAVCTVDGLGPFLEVPKADKLSIEIERFQTIALVGFGKKSTAAGSSWLDWLLWGGIALVVIGVVVLVLLTFKRKKVVEETESEENTEEGSPRHILIKPVSEEAIESEEMLSPEEIAQKVLMDFDEQTDLTFSEREQFRAKEPTDDNAFDAVSESVVSAAEQIGDHQRETIRRTMENAQASKNASLTVDDLLDELTRDLDDLSDR